MRILLLYPPPWKIPEPGEELDRSGEGPYEGWTQEHLFGHDEMRMPYGVLSLAAQAKRSGHKVTLLNLYGYTWQTIVKLIKKLPADIYGISCFTHNRRGAVSLSNLIRETRPETFIVMGGPHASALPEEMLAHCEAIDAVVVGEGESAFMELVERLINGKPVEGIDGIAYGTAGGIRIEPPGERIKHLDSLASPYDYYSGDVILSTRGCPGKCTFCSSPSIWGKAIRYHSADYVLRMLERMIGAHGKKVISIKDDTFTFNRKRVLEICRGIQERGLNFVWSCDTRVDALDEEILFAMRKAGCQRISFGVESASPEILRTINKHTGPEKVLAVTEMAKKFGFQIRYYMIAGNRNETAETLQASIDFLEKAKPTQFLFYFLMIFPGTKEFTLAEQKGLIDRETFFKKDWPFFAYPLPNKMDPEMAEGIKWIYKNIGSTSYWEYSVQDRESILSLFPDLASAYLDLGIAHFRSENLTDAKKYILDALQKDYPVQATGYNNLACIAATQGDIPTARKLLDTARKYGRHSTVSKNIQTLNEAAEMINKGNHDVYELSHSLDIEPEPELRQPIAPGPIRIVTV